MNQLPISKQDAVAFFRFQVISPLFNAKRGFIVETAKEIAAKEHNDVVNQKLVTFSLRTIYNYYSNYKKYGFDGLKPKTRCDKGHHPQIDPEIISEIIALKKELPIRSSAKIISMLTISGKIEKGLLRERTVNRILNQYGYTNQVLIKNKRIYAKHEKDKINEMWQSDVMSSFYIPDGNGGKKMAYLIGMIDDNSRKDMHSEFYLDSTLSRLEDTLRKAVIKHGIPLSIYVDNGKIFISDQFKLICAKLGIRLRFATPRNCSGKGKIERYWKTVQDSFLSEIKNQPINSLSELNDLYFAWKQSEYDEKIHTSIGISPNQKWKNSLNQGTKLKFLSPVELEEIFLHSQERTVTKYGVISFEGNTYEVSSELIGKKIVVRYNPFHLEYLHIYYMNKYFGTAKIIDLKTQRHKSVGSIPEESGYESQISRLYFENIKSNYQKFLKEQLDSSIDSSCVGNNDITIDEKDKKNHPSRPQKPKQTSMTRAEFINIVKNAIGIDHLTFQEKGRLNELFETFKEFNKDILASILDDLSKKSNDFNRNFLYYIAQIRNLYIKNIEIAKEHKK